MKTKDGLVFTIAFKGKFSKRHEKLITSYMASVRDFITDDEVVGLIYEKATKRRKKCKTSKNS